MNTRIIGLAAGFFLLNLLLVSGSCSTSLWGQEKAYKEETKTFEVAKLDRIYLSTRSGRIEAIGTADEKIQITMVKRASGSSKVNAQALLEQIRVLEKREGSQLRLVADFPKGLEANRASVDFLVSLPVRYALDLNSQNGPISLQGMQGHISARSYNGSIKIQGCREAVHASAFRGEVEVSGNPTSMDLSSQSGKVTVQLDSLRAFERESRIETFDGPVELNLPPGFSARFHAFSSEGKIQLQVPGKWDTQENFEYVGIIGIGGPRLKVDSHHGDVVVKEKK